jgi:hypothetical protein
MQRGCAAIKSCDRIISVDTDGIVFLNWSLIFRKIFQV